MEAATEAAMSLSPDQVAAASAATTWVPDNATSEETDEYRVVRLPDYFDPPLRLLRFSPAGPLEPALEAALDRARQFGLPDLQWTLAVNSPPELAGLLEARGATVTETVDVLALDLANGAPALPPPDPDLDLTVNWATDLQTITDSTELAAEIFGGSVPPQARLIEIAERDSAAIPGGRGGMVVAYADETPLGTGGVAITTGVARLWGGAVRPAARGRGVYRATLAARLDYCAAHGATMALVNARVETSAPILRQAGFAPYGQELRYRVPL
jgi:GNAT superfamily N-acetyltransferase